MNIRRSEWHISAGKMVSPVAYLRTSGSRSAFSPSESPWKSKSSPSLALGFLEAPGALSSPARRLLPVVLLFTAAAGALAVTPEAFCVLKNYMLIFIIYLIYIYCYICWLNGSCSDFHLLSLVAWSQRRLAAGGDSLSGTVLGLMLINEISC